MWEYRGQKRPAFALPTQPGQESVWDYTRPPTVQPCDRQVVVEVGGQTLARSTTAYRVMETASPPGFYIPENDVDWDKLAPAAGSSVCEWKGAAGYWRLASQPAGIAVGWIYPGRVDCYVDGEKVRPQPGEFYGGWITEDVVGPFKGERGTGHW
jgi:uncharacterized protein (DUF427 family)